MTTTPPAEAVEAAHQALWDLHDAKRTLLSRNAAAEVTAAVVAALNLPERDRETAAKAWDEGVVRGLQTADWEYGAGTNMPDQANPYRASALREGRDGRG
jgi:hypothetical protein